MFIGYSMIVLGVAGMVYSVYGFLTEKMVVFDRQGPDSLSGGDAKIYAVMIFFIALVMLVVGIDKVRNSYEKYW